MNFEEINEKNATYDEVKCDSKTKLCNLQVVYFLNETSILVFAKLAIFHFIEVTTSLGKIMTKITG